MIVLDTHAWIWWVSDPEQLSVTARGLIEQAVEAESVHISCISAWEVAMLVERGRLELTMAVEDWVAKSESLPFFNFVPITNAIALKSVALPAPLHHDPADRIIVATSMTLGATLVTRDEKLLAYPHVKTAW